MRLSPHLVLSVCQHERRAKFVVTYEDDADMASPNDGALLRATLLYSYIPMARYFVVRLLLVMLLKRAV